MTAMAGTEQSKAAMVRRRHVFIAYLQVNPRKTAEGAISQWNVTYCGLPFVVKLYIGRNVVPPRPSRRAAPRQRPDRPPGAFAGSPAKTGGREPGEDHPLAEGVQRLP